MSSLSDALNKVSRLVTPELRDEDERKRKEAEVAACNDFLKQKEALEAQLVRANTSVSKRAAGAAQASQYLDNIDRSALKSSSEAVIAAAKTIERYMRDIAPSDKENLAFARFLDETAWEFTRVTLFLRNSATLGSVHIFGTFDRGDFSKVEKGMAAWKVRIAELRQSLTDGIDPASREGQKLFFKEDVVGHKTERRAGYPFVFLTEKVQVPVTKRTEFTADQKAAAVKKYVDAIDVFETKIPELLKQATSIAQAVAKVSAYDDAKLSAQGAQAQLDKIPADLVEKVQCHVAALNKGGLVIKGR